ncbi:hypothetical protein KPH14_001003 [Odynerus spinipes]|uniref:Uncharacterized protein n=1 Tax=Odynerus spinipes TaxID=1348599 RepID=A0AAD9RJN9_9HYME|nr:hypothetical protein KPH14_001003 [Odynerus spinipes]
MSRKRGRSGSSDREVEEGHFDERLKILEDLLRRKEEKKRRKNRRSHRRNLRYSQLSADSPCSDGERLDQGPIRYAVHDEFSVEAHGSMEQLTPRREVQADQVAHREVSVSPTEQVRHFSTNQQDVYQDQQTTHETVQNQEEIVLDPRLIEIMDKRKWKEVTSDRLILSWIEGYKIPFESFPTQVKPPSALVACTSLIL